MSLPQIDADHAAGIIDPTNPNKHLSQIPTQPRNRHDHRIERMYFRRDEEHSQDSSRAKCARDVAEVSVPQNLKNGWGCAATEQSSDAERGWLVQRKRKAGLKPGPLHTGEQLNGDHKRCGERGETTQ
jgi:hypothetical protein